VCAVWPIGAASVGSKGESDCRNRGDEASGIVAVSDDGNRSLRLNLPAVMDYCRSADIPVIEHAEDVSLAAGR